MQDSTILEQIGRLVEAEHALRNRGTDHPLSADEEAQLHHVEVSLDQLWDLLRRRRARREFGRDPDAAKLRDASTVERYTG